MNTKENVNAEMKTKMVTLRLNKEMALCCDDILNMQPRLKRKSEVYRYAFETTSRAIKESPASVDFDKIVLEEFPEDEGVEIDFPETRKVTIYESDYNTVAEHFKKTMNMDRAKAKYLTRLVLIFARIELRELVSKKGLGNITVKNVDGVNLLKDLNVRGAEALSKGETYKVMKALEELN